MKKEIVKRSLLGIPLGITISYLLSIIISYLEALYTFYV